MLVQLTISNFAIIDHIDIHYRPGLNILSGETGAGKSIIINAVNLILGGRATADLIRSGAEEARVEALFEVPENAPLMTVLTENGIPCDGELLIKRTLSREGRNKIMINGSISTLQTLSRLGLMLISISGQHEHQLLLKPDNHIYFLDDFGGLQDRRLALNRAFNAYQALREQQKKCEKEIRAYEAQQELERFQIEEIEKADIGENEDQKLESEKSRLKYAERLKSIITAVYLLLYEKDDAIISEISHSIKKLESGAELDSRLISIMETLESARLDLEEAALALREMEKSAVIDPRRLEEVEDRLQLLHHLKRKYGPTLDEVLAFKTRLCSKMDSFDAKREELQGITRQIKAMEEEIMGRAEELSENRRKAALMLDNAVRHELELLAMAGTRFEVRFHVDGGRGKTENGDTMGTMKADGFDTVEFMLSPNIGEELKPLSKIASGGELSRIMLAMKTILAKTGAVETIVFDEVDAGIGGATAEVVGEKLHSLSRYHQILCITHLPQIASKGRTHFQVQKKVIKKRTCTLISELNDDERIEEIARLLGGKRISKQALAHAVEMLGVSV
ncbi:MAG: DNA repair protein RecN [Deltaproteobacteria bacterium]|nr:DNA repair protein RecN [Deltaproteobacteria bacterium]